MTTNRQDLIEELRWKKFPVGSDGFVCLVDLMGDDTSVVQAARVSYGVGTKKVSDDQTLIRYLLRHRHTTPFEMAEIKLLVRVPMDCWRQWIRHRTASVNEYSTRYSEAIESMAKTGVADWRTQAKNNKQGSDGYLPVEIGQHTSEDEAWFQSIARDIYQRRLDAGVAKEQARKDLPLSTYTEAYWKNDLHNTLHFLGLRMDGHAQQEIREYANIIGQEIIRPLFPLVWEAFEDYRLHGKFLSRLDQVVIQALSKKAHSELQLTLNCEWANQVSESTAKDLMPPYSVQFFRLVADEVIPEWRDKERCRERDECLEKLQSLGLVREK